MLTNWLDSQKRVSSWLLHKARCWTAPITHRRIEWSFSQQSAPIATASQAQNTQAAFGCARPVGKHHKRVNETAGGAWIVMLLQRQSWKITTNYALMHKSIPRAADHWSFSPFKLCQEDFPKAPEHGPLNAPYRTGSFGRMHPHNKSFLIRPLLIFRPVVNTCGGKIRTLRDPKNTVTGHKPGGLNQQAITKGHKQTE